MVTSGYLWFISFFFTLPSLVAAQSYHYLENQFLSPEKNKVTYHTFITVEPDGSAVARIRFIDPITEEDKLLQLLLVDSFPSLITTENSNKYLMAPAPPIWISGTGTFYQPRIIFTKKEDGYFSPLAMEIQTSTGNWTKTETLVNEEKSYEEIKAGKEFVSLFYNETDEFYKYLYDDYSFRSILPIIRTEKIHLLIVANTIDPTIGVSSAKDLENIKNTFSQLAASLGVKLISTIISGSSFGKKQVDKALTQLQPNDRDIVIFYYSGHGFRYTADTSKYPRLSLRTNRDQELNINNIGLEDVFNKIVKKRARVTIVVGDCCNEDIGAQPPVGRELLRTRFSVGTPQVLNLDNANALFFSKKPIQILTSSTEKNQLAIGNPGMGGFFTNFFSAQLNKSLYGYEKSMSWLKILLDAKEKARKQALSALCGNGRCVQLAEIKVEPPM